MDKTRQNTELDKRRKDRAIKESDKKRQDRKGYRQDKTGLDKIGNYPFLLFPTLSCMDRI